MTHQEHVRLIEKAIPRDNGGVWADVGSGEGAFTLALRDLAGPNVEIFSIDLDPARLAKQEKQFLKQFPNTNIQYMSADISHNLILPDLDGIIAANVIHFFENREAVLRLLKQYIKPQGKLVIVEYNVDRGNIWVPYPFSYHTFTKLAHDAGYVDTRQLASIPSHFLQEIYSALTYTP